MLTCPPSDLLLYDDYARRIPERVEVSHLNDFTETYLFGFRFDHIRSRAGILLGGWGTTYDLAHNAAIVVLNDVAEFAWKIGGVESPQRFQWWTVLEAEHNPASPSLVIIETHLPDKLPPRDPARRSDNTLYLYVNPWSTLFVRFSGGFIATGHQLAAKDTELASFDATTEWRKVFILPPYNTEEVSR